WAAGPAPFNQPPAHLGNEAADKPDGIWQWNLLHSNQAWRSSLDRPPVCTLIPACHDAYVEAHDENQDALFRGGFGPCARGLAHKTKAPPETDGAPVRSAPRLRL